MDTCKHIIFVLSRHTIAITDVHLRRASTRNGTNLTFLEVVKAIVFVYNLSYPLAVFLAMAGFLTAGKFLVRSLLLNSPKAHLRDLGDRDSSCRHLGVVISASHNYSRPAISGSAWTLQNRPRCFFCPPQWEIFYRAGSNTRA